VFLVSLLLLSQSDSLAANRYAVSSGAWNATSTWSSTSGGSSGASVAVAGDNVFIAEGTTYTVTIPLGYSAACESIQLGTANGSTNGIIMFGAATSSLTVSGNVDLYQPSASSTREIDVYNGTLTINGNLNMNVVASSTSSTRVSKVLVTTGTVTVAGNSIGRLIPAGGDVGSSSVGVVSLWNAASTFGPL
jgi:hypothetical protein